MDKEAKTVLTLLKSQKKQKNWDAMLVTAQEAVAKFPQEKALWKQLEVAQMNYVDAKLDSDLVHQMEEKHEYASLLQVYQRLLMVFPESKKLKKLMKDAEKDQYKDLLKQQKTQFDEAQKKIKQLAKEGRYEEAVHSSYELLIHAPENPKFIKLKDKMLLKREKSINKELDAIFDKSIQLIADQFSADPESILKV